MGFSPSMERGDYLGSDFRRDLPKSPVLASQPYQLVTARQCRKELRLMLREFHWWRNCCRILPWPLLKGTFANQQGVYKRSFAEVATFRQRLFIWLLDRICGSSGLRRLLPRLSGRRHNSWRSAS